jgi:hypothetical protein
MEGKPDWVLSRWKIGEGKSQTLAALYENQKTRSFNPVKSYKGCFNGLFFRFPRLSLGRYFRKIDIVAE